MPSETASPAEVKSKEDRHTTPRMARETHREIADPELCAEPSSSTFCRNLLDPASPFFGHAACGTAYSISACSVIAGYGLLITAGRIVGPPGSVRYHGRTRKAFTSHDSDVTRRCGSYRDPAEQRIIPASEPPSVLLTGFLQRIGEHGGMVQMEYHAVLRNTGHTRVYVIGMAFAAEGLRHTRKGAPFSSKPFPG